jgi:hypothetical protein
LGIHEELDLHEAARMNIARLNGWENPVPLSRVLRGIPKLKKDRMADHVGLYRGKMIFIEVIASDEEWKVAGRISLYPALTSPSDLSLWELWVVFSFNNDPEYKEYEGVYLSLAEEFKKIAKPEIRDNFCFKMFSWIAPNGEGEKSWPSDLEHLYSVQFYPKRS